jgi:protein SCO1/2
LLALLLAAPANALTPATLARVDASPITGAALPLDAAFHDERGRAVTLRDYFGARPAIVVLGYYGCSNLCSLVLRGVREALDGASLQAGRDVDVVVVSIAAQETPAMAAAKMRDILGASDARGWHFLTGSQPAIDAVTRALDYRYAWDASAGQYAHAAGITLADAQGRVRATLPGIAYSSAALRAQLAPGGSPRALAAGGSSRAHVPWQLCFGFDPQTGRYTGAVTTAVRITALAALCALLACVLVARRRQAT